MQNHILFLYLKNAVYLFIFIIYIYLSDPIRNDKNNALASQGGKVTTQLTLFLSLSILLLVLFF